MSNIYNVSDVDKTRMDESITDVTGKSELVEIKEQNIKNFIKVDICGFDIADVSDKVVFRSNEKTWDKAGW